MSTSAWAPTPPTDVRAVMADGREIPLECVYAGRLGGRHEWVATWPLPERPARFFVGELPAHTSVSIEWVEL